MDSIDQQIVKSIEKAFLKYGNTVSSVVFYYCSAKKIPKEEVPSKPDLFEENLQRIFGDTSKVIIRSIVEELINAFSLPDEEYPNLKRVIHVIKNNNHPE